MIHHTSLYLCIYVLTFYENYNVPQIYSSLPWKTEFRVRNAYIKNAFNLDIRLKETLWNIMTNYNFILRESQLMFAAISQRWVLLWILFLYMYAGEASYQHRNLQIQHYSGIILRGWSISLNRKDISWRRTLMHVWFGIHV